MNLASGARTEGDDGLDVLWDDGKRIFCRGWRADDAGNKSAVLVVLLAGEHSPPALLNRLTHEFGLKDDLESAWAVRPLKLWRNHGRTMLVLEDPGDEPLGRLLVAPMETGSAEGSGANVHRSDGVPLS